MAGDGARGDVGLFHCVLFVFFVFFCFFFNDTATTEIYTLSLHDALPISVVLWDWINELLRNIGIAPIAKRVSYKAAYSVGGFLENYWKFARKPGEPPMTRFVAKIGRAHV